MKHSFRKPVSPLALLSFLLFSAVSSFSVPSARADSGGETPAEARLELVTMAETGAVGATVDQVRKLVESYRVDSRNGFMPLRLAPYPRFLLDAQLGQIYSALYQSQLDGFLDEIPLDVLLDGVLSMVVDDQVPPDLKDQLSGLDKRMARRALQAKDDPRCVLDLSEKLEKVTKLQLLALKIDLIDSISPCTYRKRIFDSAKESLLKARKEPGTKKQVKDAALKLDPKLGESPFQSEFRKGFLGKVNGLVADFPSLVQTKFGAGTAVHPIWSDLGSVLESGALRPGSNGRKTIDLKVFAQGLLADLYAANVLLGSDLPRDRSLAAGLFYSVVNRWLLLTGGIEADWDPVRNEIPIADRGAGTKPPKFREVPFGGWGAESAGFGVSMSAWDWGGYHPTDSKSPSPLRIFPSRFEIDDHGVATMGDSGLAYQTNDDLAYLLLAVSEFLKSTQPGAPLSKFFGGADRIADLLDPKKPMLFPDEGRMVAVGVLSAIAQNLLDPEIGHVASKRDGIPIYFRDHGSFGTLQTTDLDTRGVCSLLVASAKLVKTLKSDPVMKTTPELKSVIPQINQLVQISALVVGREQGFDGSIPAKMVSSDKSTSLGAQVAAVRVFLAAFNSSETPANATFVMARLVPAMTYLFSTQISDPSKLDLEARLNVRAVWNQSQSALRKARPELPWSEWAAAVRKL